MLGPEQLNIASRPLAPLSEGFTNLYVSEKVAKHIGLKDNQIIRGVVVGREGLLKVVINNQVLDLLVTRGLKVGDSIDFRVERGVDGKLLRPLGLLPLETGAAAIPAAAIESGAASRLLSLLYRPKQSSLQAQLLKPENLIGLLNQHIISPSNKTALDVLGSISNLSPQLIRSALLNSGLFAEYFLANKLPVRQDIKQIIRSLAAEKTISESAKLTLENTADEIESYQLTSIQAQNNREVYYQFFLPFSDENPVNIEFERGPLVTKGAAPDWVINLHLESEAIGQIWLKTTIRPEAKIEMIVWAERMETAQIIKGGIVQLTENLAHFDLQLAKLNVLNMSRPNIDAALSSPGQVLDVRT